MFGVFQNIDPRPLHRPANVYSLVRGRTHSLGGEGGGGSIFWKTPDTALYSTYVSTLWDKHTVFVQIYRYDRCYHCGKRKKFHDKLCNVMDLLKQAFCVK
jgi:hypothetical protein